MGKKVINSVKDAKEKLTDDAYIALLELCVEFMESVILCKTEIEKIPLMTAFTVNYAEIIRRGKK